MTNPPQPLQGEARSPETGRPETTTQCSMDVVGGFGRSIRKLEALCDTLEAIADDLPRCRDHQACLYVARALPAVVVAAHRYEERTIFPLLALIAPDSRETRSRLHTEHLTDESYADEIAEALRDFVAERGRLSAEALGYMLRGFFEGMRRHLAFEREHVLAQLFIAAAATAASAQPGPIIAAPEPRHG